MPKENKQRGRREKRKRQIEEVDIPSKRPKPEESDEQQQGDLMRLDDAVLVAEQAPDTKEEEVERPFYGMLDDEDQEYFRGVDEMLERNSPEDFPSEEDKALFIRSIFERAKGQELKIANSQSCSRLMEKLILLSTAEQKKGLFEKFSGNFMHLIQHRFASHCCETLFIHSAPVVTEELTADSEVTAKHMEGDDVYVTMENLFLYTLNELEGHMAQLLTDRHASHALRVLLIILSGRPLEAQTTKSLVHSKKKEKVGVAGFTSGATEQSLGARAVPESFDFAVQKIISDTVAALDTSFIRVLATHPTGNPTLQLLLELELTQQGKSKGAAAENSIISKLLPDDLSDEGSESAVFVNGLIYEPIGSRLLETIVTHAPGKLFKSLYRTTFKERIGSLARNEIASFVVIKVLERLSKDDLIEAVDLILPQLPGLIERSRTTVIKTMLDRCQARKAWKSSEVLAKAIGEGYGSDVENTIIKMTQFTPTPPTTDEGRFISVRPGPEAVHGSLLAQAMLSIPGPSEKLVQDSLLSQPPSVLLAMSLQTHTSHVIQAALASTATNVPFRRKLINNLISSTSSSPSPITQLPLPGVLVMALSKPGSHTLDAMFTSTNSLFSLKERIIGTLVSHEHELRESDSGRVVWRNWMCQLFKNNRGEWVGKCKSGEGGAGSGAAVGVVKLGEVDPQNGVMGSSTKEKQISGARPKAHGKEKGASGKTALELAREKYAANKTGKEIPQQKSKFSGKGGFKPTGANAGLVQSR